jgi:hypothetical protein
VAIWHAVVWAIWNARNDLIFNVKAPVSIFFKESFCTLGNGYVKKRKGLVALFMNGKHFQRIVF